jgi:hypothetical protein
MRVGHGHAPAHANNVQKPHGPGNYPGLVPMLPRQALSWLKPAAKNKRNKAPSLDLRFSLF